jgi:hypothetical protein
VKKLKVTFKGDVVKTFDLEHIDIMPVPQSTNGPSMMNLMRRGENRYALRVTSDIIPDVTFLEKMEIIE